MLDATKPDGTSQEPGLSQRFVRQPIKRYQNHELRDIVDDIIEEVEISVQANGRYVGTLTCSPWDLEEMVIGYLSLKGIVRDWRDFVSIDIDVAGGCAEVLLKVDPENLDALDLPMLESGLSLSPQKVIELAALLEQGSSLFRMTGGVHSAALVQGDEVLARFEDISRHSAMDKLAGWCLLNGVDGHEKVLLFSGRVPFEIITATIRLACPIIIARGAPTKLSVDLAEKHGVTVIGFAKQQQFNVYTHAERVL